MPSVTLNRKVFESLIGIKLSEKELKDRISMIGTDLEKLDKNEIHVEIFPNRPDMLSEQGFSRAFSSFIGKKTGLRKYKVNKSDYKVRIDKSVTMRPFTACAIVKNLKFSDEKIRELMQMQEKLSTTHGRRRVKSEYGIYPSTKINFPITYIAKDPKTVSFQPLGMDKVIRADKVESLHHTGREFNYVAKGWTKYPFFIDAKDNVMAMLPYTNSHDTGKIDESTNEVFIECSGTNFNNVNVALNMFVTTLADMGGEIFEVELEYPDKKIITPNLNPEKMKLDLNYVNKRLGFSLKETDVKKCLEKMGFGYENKHALIPAYRADILHQVDLIEDIAIAFGYENIPEVIPNVPSIAEESKFEVFKNRITHILIGLGLLECKTYHITNNVIQSKLMNTKIETIELANALNEEFSVLASWHIPSLIEVLKNNKHHEYPQNIFTIGRIFKKDNKQETGILEQDRLAVLLCQDTADYTKIRQVFDYLFRMLDIDYKVVETNHSSFIKGRVGRVISKNKKLAYIGEISPLVLENFELEMPISAFELNLSELFEIINK